MVVKECRADISTSTTASAEGYVWLPSPEAYAERVGLQGDARLFPGRCLFPSLVFAVNELSADREVEQVAGPNSLTVTPIVMVWVGNVWFAFSKATNLSLIK